MKAPKLTAVATVHRVDDRFAVYGRGVAINLTSSHAIREVYGPLLRRECAVRITIEPSDAPDATPLRSAEEIAREMVPDAGWLQLGTDGVRLASDVSVPHARAILTRLIEQSRAEGAAAERERAEQPRDVAGRIRALIQEYAGRWADAPNRTEEKALQDAMSELREALRDVGNRSRITERIGQLRDGHERWTTYGAVMHRCADELEAIIRECAPEEPR